MDIADLVIIHSRVLKVNERKIYFSKLRNKGNNK